MGEANRIALRRLQRLVGQRYRAFFRSPARAVRLRRPVPFGSQGLCGGSTERRITHGVTPPSRRGPIQNRPRNRGTFTLDQTLWKSCLADLGSATEVPVFDLLLLEAEYYVAVEDLRQAVLDADAACEHLKEVVFQRLWESRNSGKVYNEKRRNDLLRNWDMPRQLDQKFKAHFGRSYKEEHPGEWSTVESLWQARNNVAHGASNEYGTPPTAVTSKTALQFVRAAGHCVRWLRGLR